MKHVFLIMYLWHRDGVGNWQVGGPAATVTPMPSIAVCEVVGSQAKTFFDARLNKTPLSGGTPTVFRCVEVAGDATSPGPAR